MNTRKAQAPTPNQELAFFGSPPLCNGEDPAAYDQLLTTITDTIKPADILEKIWVRDIVDIQWDILRVRRIKACVINMAEEDARERALDVLTLPFTLGGDPDEEPEPFPPDSLERLLFAADVSLHELAAKRLKAEGRRKAGASLEQGNLLAQGVAKQIDIVERLDNMLLKMEARRNNQCAEIDNHRANLGARLRQAAQQIEDAEFREVDSTPDERKLAA